MSRMGHGLVMKSLAAAAALATGLTVAARAEDLLSLKAAANCEMGGDIRIRQVHFDNIPIVADPPGVTRAGENHFFRFRTRLWGRADFSEQVSVYARVVNEFRHYETGVDTSWDWADELIVDALYLNVKGMFGGLVDARIGRQDMIYGTGKLILEGTPKDGSRTIYSDAAVFTVHAHDKCTVDLFGIYNQAENQLAVNSQRRDLTGYTPGFNDGTESGAGIYAKNRMFEGCPFEAYYIFKNESDWVNRQGDAVPGRDIHTVGTRLMPRMNAVSANIELAAQFGETEDDRSIEGQMADVTVKYAFAEKAGKPSLGAGFYYISGDDPDTNRDEGWNPLWARWPQYSELYVYAYDAQSAGRWSNVSMPYISMECQPSGKTKLMLLAGDMRAPEADGPGGGRGRGLLGVARLDFTLASKIMTDKDRLSGHLTVEVLEPGSYYNVDSTAHFARWEISYAF